jgi:hypothetical protein
LNTFTAAICFTLLLAIVTISPSSAAFGGQPPLGPKDDLRHLFKPYDLMKLNYLGMNYCENLLDLRTNATSYTHLNYDNNAFYSVSPVRQHQASLFGGILIIEYEKSLATDAVSERVVCACAWEMDRSYTFSQSAGELQPANR